MTVSLPITAAAVFAAFCLGAVIGAAISSSRPRRSRREPNFMDGIEGFYRTASSAPPPRRRRGDRRDRRRCHRPGSADRSPARRAGRDEAGDHDRGPRMTTTPFSDLVEMDTSELVEVAEVEQAEIARLVAKVTEAATAAART